MQASRLEEDIAAVGKQVRQKILLALALSGVIPLLILTYLLHAHIMPRLDPARPGMPMLWMQLLIVCTGLLIAGGAAVIWDVAVAVAWAARLAADGRRARTPEERPDEVGALTQSVSNMIETIEAQPEIGVSAGPLDTDDRELERANARLKELSVTDDLTGLYNRRFFSIRLEEELSRHRRYGNPLSVVMLDLDGFKAVNDTMGHAVGDETLRDVAQILQKHSRGFNVIARYGGDQFAVLLVETSKARARFYADRIREVLATYPFSHGCSVTASFGIASVPEDEGRSAEEILRSADDALGGAKRAGKNQVVSYEPVLAERTIESAETPAA